MKNGDVPVQSGPLNLASGSANVSVPATEPRAYLLEVYSTAAPDAKPLVAVAGAAVDPTHITPHSPPPPTLTPSGPPPSPNSPMCP